MVVGLLGSLLGVIATSPSFSQSSTATTILTVGDSICHGAIGDRPWRFNLQQHLAASGLVVDFVGEFSEGYNGDIDPNRPTYPTTAANWDRDTSCYWGRPAFMEQASIAARVSNTNPDYVLMMLGTNDLTLLKNAINASYYGKLAINNALDADLDMKMVVGGVPPSSWFGFLEAQLEDKQGLERGSLAGSLVREYNDQLKEHIALLQFDAKYEGRVVFVDTFSGPWTVGDDTYDGTHPSPAGYDKIAEQFASGLSQFGLLRNVVYTSPAVEPSPRPAAPTNLRATPGPEMVTLEWTPSDEGNGYRIFQSVDGGPFEMVLSDLSRNSSSQIIRDLEPGKTYRFYLQSEYAVEVDAFDPDNPLGIRQVTIDNVGPRTAVVTVDRHWAALPVPSVTGLTVEAGVDSIFLKWNPVPMVRDYRIYRSVNGGPFEPIRWGFTESSTLAPAVGSSNYFQFQVEVSIGTRVSSKVTTKTIKPLPRPDQPAVPEVLRSGIGAVVFWEEVPGAAGYELQRKDSLSGEWIDVYFGTDLNSIQRPLLPGVEYFYRVRALLPYFHYTRWSQPEGITIPTTGRAPEPPANLVGRTDVTSAWLNWDHSEMADEYQVLMSKQRFGTYRTVSYNSGLSARYIYGLEPDTTYFFRVKAISSQIGELATTAPIRLRTQAPFPGLDCTPPSPDGLYEAERYRLFVDAPTYNTRDLRVPGHLCESEASGTLRYRRGKEYTVSIVAGPFAYIDEAKAWVRLTDLIPVDSLLNPQNCPSARATTQPGSVFGMRVRGDRARVVNEKCEVVGYLDKGYEIVYQNIGKQVRGSYVEKRAGLGADGWIQLSDLEVVRTDALDGLTGSWGFCMDLGGDAVVGASVQSCYFMNRDEDMVVTTSNAVTGGFQAGVNAAVIYAESDITNLQAHGGNAVCGNVDLVLHLGLRWASCWSLWKGYRTNYFGVAFGAGFALAGAFGDTKVNTVTNPTERRWVKNDICSKTALFVYHQDPPFC